MLRAVTWRTWAVFIPWAVAWKIALAYGWGFIFLAVSFFVYVWFNLDDSEQRGLSAYSIFNKGFQRLPGTFTVEQFEGELMGRRPPGE